MKTTELYFEQVLIGFLILLIALLPWLPEGICLLPRLNSFGDFAIVSSAALGIAFFLGIPFDRLSDTLIERIDKLQRLSTAFVQARKEEFSDAPDLYPEDKLLLTCLRGRAIMERMDYHRSRIRLTRALAVYGPALTMMATYGVSRYLEGKGCPLSPGSQPRAMAYGWVAAAYLVWWFLILVSKELPRTDDHEEFVVRAKDGLWIDRWPWTICPWNIVENSKGKPKRVRELVIWCLEWQTWVIPVALLIGAIVVTRSYSDRWPLLVAGTGAILTLLSVWSWFRITVTYRRFLLDVSRFNPSAIARY